MTEEGRVIPQYNKDQLKELLKGQNWKAIDVRTDEEYQAGHIPNVPLKTMQDVSNWMGELNPDESYIFICRSGGRSQRVAEFLRQNGFQHVANFNGGMLSWDGETKSGATP